VSANTDTTIELLERLAFESWPAAEVLDVDGWRLRHTGGVTRRANSVWTNEARGVEPLSGRISAVERFYRQRGQPPRFQLSPLAKPSALDAELASRGYGIEAPTSIQVADAGAAAATEVTARVRIEAPLFDDWFEISARRGRFRGVEDVYRGLLDRLGDRAFYALAEDGGQPAAVGLLVIDRAWAGIFSMLTLEAHRRRGLGKALVHAMARHALGRGVERLYLQVELENEASRALYAACGFRERYRYHYRLST
jgi:N-acetylglutamate synthase